MINGILITNDATHHPAESWAVATAQTLVSVEETVAGATRIDGLALQAGIARALTGLYQRAQDEEHKLLAADPAGRAQAGFEDVERYAGDAWAAVQHAAAGNAFGGALLAREAEVKHVLSSHIASILDIHRKSFGKAA